MDFEPWGQDLWPGVVLNFLMSDLQSIAKAFVDYYYATFDRSRAELSPLYVNDLL